MSIFRINNNTLVCKRNTEGTTSYRYDDKGNLIEAVLPNNTKISYMYNANNQRTTKLINNQITEKYLWLDLTTLLAVYDKDDNLNFNHFGQKINFANVIRIDNNIKTSIFEFCPDGTCDIVIIDGVLSAESTLDYGMLYLYYFSDYFSNNERLEIHNERFAKKIFSKYNCHLKDANAICSMKKILKNFEATIYYGRYDEGKLCIYKKS